MSKAHLSVYHVNLDKPQLDQEARAKIVLRDHSLSLELPIVHFVWVGRGQVHALLDACCAVQENFPVLLEPQIRQHVTCVRSVRSIHNTVSLHVSDAVLEQL